MMFETKSYGKTYKHEDHAWTQASLPLVESFHEELLHGLNPQRPKTFVGNPTKGEGTMPPSATHQQVIEWGRREEVRHQPPINVLATLAIVAAIVFVVAFVLVVAIASWLMTKTRYRTCIHVTCWCHCYVYIAPPGSFWSLTPPLRTPPTM